MKELKLTSFHQKKWKLPNIGLHPLGNLKIKTNNGRMTFFKEKKNIHLLSFLQCGLFFNMVSIICKFLDWIYKHISNNSHFIEPFSRNPIFAPCFDLMTSFLKNLAPTLLQYLKTLKVFWKNPTCNKLENRFDFL
jgi:hypothetical protein